MDTMNETLAANAWSVLRVDRTEFAEALHRAVMFDELTETAMACVDRQVFRLIPEPSLREDAFAQSNEVYALLRDMLVRFVEHGQLPVDQGEIDHIDSMMG